MPSPCPRAWRRVSQRAAPSRGAEAVTRTGLSARDTRVVASANLDLVRSICAAWEAGDYSSAEWAVADIESVIADGPAPGTWTGLAGMAEGFREFLDAWDEARHEVEEYCELDGERVLVLTQISARGKTSGVELAHVRTNAAVLFHLRNGKVTRLVLYLDREHALVDVGLRTKKH